MSLQVYETTEGKYNQRKKDIGDNLPARVQVNYHQWIQVFL